MSGSLSRDDTNAPGLKSNGLWAGLLALIIGCAVLWLFNELGLNEALGDGTFIAVVALPLIAYALIVYSDRVSEVSAGGVAVKFANFANTEVDANPTSADAEADIGPISIIQKSSIDALRQRRERLSPKDKVALTIAFGRKNNYNKEDVHTYLNVLLAQDADMPVIFVDDAKRFVASTMGVKLRDALSQTAPGRARHPFIKAIAAGVTKGLGQLADVVALTKTSLPPKTSNAEALQAMLAEDVSILVSVDDAGQPVGVVRREEIMARMLTALASDEDAS